MHEHTTLVTPRYVAATALAVVGASLAVIFPLAMGGACRLPRIAPAKFARRRRARRRPGRHRAAAHCGLPLSVSDRRSSTGAAENISLPGRS